MSITLCGHFTQAIYRNRPIQTRIETAGFQFLCLLTFIDPQGASHDEHSPTPSANSNGQALNS